MSAESWQLRCAELKQRGAYLYQSKLWSDCTFQLDDVVIKAHKLIMAMASPVFSKMLYGSFVKFPMPIYDVRPEVFDVLLEYIYSDNLNVKSSKDACDLYYAAKRWRLPHVAKCCVKYLNEHLSPENVCHIYKVACESEDATLQMTCEKIFSTRTKEILKDKSFFEVDLAIVKKIFSLDLVNIDNELDLFEAAVKYAKIQDQKTKTKKLQRRTDDDNITPDDEPTSPKRPRRDSQDIFEDNQASNNDNSNQGGSPINDSERSQDSTLDTIDGEVKDTRDKHKYRDLVKSIRFLTLTPYEFAECTCLQDLLTTSEILALSMNIASKETQFPMPEGLCTRVVPRTQVTKEDRTRLAAVFRSIIHNIKTVQRYESMPFYLRNLAWTLMVLAHCDSDDLLVLGVTCFFENGPPEWVKNTKVKIKFSTHKLVPKRLHKISLRLSVPNPEYGAWVTQVKREDILNPDYGFTDDFNTVTYKLYVNTVPRPNESPDAEDLANSTIVSTTDNQLSNIVLRVSKTPVPDKSTTKSNQSVLNTSNTTSTVTTTLQSIQALPCNTTSQPRQLAKVTTNSQTRSSSNGTIQSQIRPSSVVTTYSQSSATSTTQSHKRSSTVTTQSQSSASSTIQSQKRPSPNVTIQSQTRPTPTVTTQIQSQSSATVTMQSQMRPSPNVTIQSQIRPSPIVTTQIQSQSSLTATIQSQTRSSPSVTIQSQTRPYPIVTTQIQSQSSLTATIQSQTRSSPSVTIQSQTRPYPIVTTRIHSHSCATVTMQSQTRPSLNVTIQSQTRPTPTVTTQIQSQSSATVTMQSQMRPSPNVTIQSQIRPSPIVTTQIQSQSSLTATIQSQTRSSPSVAIQSQTRPYPIVTTQIQSQSSFTATLQSQTRSSPSVTIQSQTRPYPIVTTQIHSQSCTTVTMQSQTRPSLNVTIQSQTRPTPIVTTQIQSQSSATVTIQSQMRPSPNVTIQSLTRPTSIVTTQIQSQTASTATIHSPMRPSPNVTIQSQTRLSPIVTTQLQSQSSATATTQSQMRPSPIVTTKSQSSDTATVHSQKRPSPKVTIQSQTRPTPIVTTQIHSQLSATVTMQSQMRPSPNVTTQIQSQSSSTAIIQSQTRSSPNVTIQSQTRTSPIVTTQIQSVTMQSQTRPSPTVTTQIQSQSSAAATIQSQTRSSRRLVIDSETTRSSLCSDIADRLAKSGISWNVITRLYGLGLSSRAIARLSETRLSSNQIAHLCQLRLTPADIAYLNNAKLPAADLARLCESGLSYQELSRRLKLIGFSSLGVQRLVSLYTTAITRPSESLKIQSAEMNTLVPPKQILSPAQPHALESKNLLLSKTPSQLSPLTLSPSQQSQMPQQVLAKGSSPLFMNPTPQLQPHPAEPNKIPPLTSPSSQIITTTDVGPARPGPYISPPSNSCLSESAVSVTADSSVANTTTISLAESTCSNPPLSLNSSAIRHTVSVGSIISSQSEIKISQSHACYTESTVSMISTIKESSSTQSRLPELASPKTSSKSIVNTSPSQSSFTAATNSKHGSPTTSLSDPSGAINTMSSFLVVDPPPTGHLDEELGLSSQDVITISHTTLNASTKLTCSPLHAVTIPWPTKHTHAFSDTRVRSKRSHPEDICTSSKTKMIKPDLVQNLSAGSSSVVPLVSDNYDQVPIKPPKESDIFNNNEILSGFQPDSLQTIVLAQLGILAQKDCFSKPLKNTTININEKMKVVETDKPSVFQAESLMNIAMSRVRTLIQKPDINILTKNFTGNKDKTGLQINEPYNVQPKSLKEIAFSALNVVLNESISENLRNNNIPYNFTTGQKRELTKEHEKENVEHTVLLITQSSDSDDVIRKSSINDGANEPIILGSVEKKAEFISQTSTLVGIALTAVNSSFFDDINKTTLLHTVQTSNSRIGSDSSSPKNQPPSLKKIALSVIRLGSEPSELLNFN